MNWLFTAAALMVNASQAMASDGTRELVLSMQDFDRVMDRAHASCASKDLEFSQGFYDCLDQAMDGIYIDSTTVRSRR